LQKQFRMMWSDRVASSPVDLNQILRKSRQTSDRRGRFYRNGNALPGRGPNAN
jgi:hypothetical protein